MLQELKNQKQPRLNEPGFHWSTSLLTKMTGVVLWTLMLLMFILAIFIIHKETHTLKNEILAGGKARMHEVLERYEESVYLEESMHQLLEKVLPSFPDDPAASQASEYIQSLLEKSKYRLDAILLQEKLEGHGNIEEIVLLTAGGMYYTSGGDPDVADLLRKNCKTRLGQGTSQTGSELHEYDRLMTLTSLALSRQGVPTAAVAAAISKKQINQRIATMRKQVFLIITLVVILLSFPIIYFLQRWVIQPIKDVSEASQELSDGHFNRRIPVQSQDEIGLLAKNFNKMAASLNYRDERLSRSYEQIETLKEYYNSIISHAPVGIMTIDRNGNVALENAALCETFYDFQSAQGKGEKRKIEDLTVFKETKIGEVFRRIMSGTVVEEEGFTVTLPSGENKVFFLKGVPLLNEQNFIQGSLLIFVDITKRTQLEERLKESNLMLEKTVQERTQEILSTNEKLKQTIDELYRTNKELVQTTVALQESNAKIVEANQMKTDFLASMSHELRTPLNAIIGFSDLILSGIDGPVNKKQKEDLQSISRSGRRLLHLINDILDLSKIEAGKTNMKKKVIDIHRLLSEIDPMAKNLIGEKPIEFLTHVGEGLRFFYADEDKILQILLNLLSNATKFTARGRILLSVQRQSPKEGADDEFLKFVVSDTGSGIQERDLDTIFNEFKQIDQSSRNAGGSGLGLSITKKLVELGGGKIWVESQHQEGSRFLFTVPTSSRNVA